ncbi:hypothetical protein T12_16126 [Trichinella patagoniensis]|uniref:Uncharacterized protein n=1 Tax=Trichinella patagoniensis TaxID=990121 RepID=A0A0V0ZUK9_9BILA|nr:hypothetical protein T12_16126 [Trichinella patagoniensis]
MMEIFTLLHNLWVPCDAVEYWIALAKQHQIRQSHTSLLCAVVNEITVRNNLFRFSQTLPTDRLSIVRRFRLGKVRYEWNCTLRFGLMKQQWMDLRLANEMFECVRITKFQILSKSPN